MSRRKIPDREPIGDAFSGIVLKYDDKYALAYEPPQEGDFEILAQGDFMVRYGVRYLGKPHLSIVPGLVALDYGEMLTGEEAWHFLLKKSNLHPRGEVLGYRNDGSDEMITIKLLDLALDLEVLVYANKTATTPLASVTGLITSTDKISPPHMKEYLPHYQTNQDWKAATGNL